MKYKQMREMTHEEILDIVKDMTEGEMLDFCASYGGYPVFFRMALPEVLTHKFPLIQNGSAIIIVNENGQILLQERTDRNKFGLPGGCQEPRENVREVIVRETLEETGLELDPKELEIIDVLSGASRRNMYPNGDIVYNQTVLFLARVSLVDASNLKGDSETKSLRFFNLEDIPENLMDKDLIEAYKEYLEKQNCLLLTKK